jgi:hypothetical protein
MQTQTSNRKELVAIHKATVAYHPILLKECVKSLQILSNNSAVVYNINRQAAALTLARSLRKLLLAIQAMVIRIKATHIPGKLNSIADALSHLEVRGITAWRRIA